MDSNSIGRWSKLISQITIPSEEAINIWNQIIRHYSEPHRAYHNCSHINDIFQQKELIENQISNPFIVDLAIFFHDIIYNPQSSTNEEDSAKLFIELFQHYIDSNTLDKVVDYIHQTKQHNVSNSNDKDLQFFIDLDMSILGRSRSEYILYCQKVRQEYIHVHHNIYCQKRSEFLYSVFQNHTNNNSNSNNGSNNNNNNNNSDTNSSSSSSSSNSNNNDNNNNSNNSTNNTSNSGSNNNNNNNNNNSNNNTNNTSNRGSNNNNNNNNSDTSCSNSSSSSSSNNDSNNNNSNNSSNNENNHHHTYIFATPYFRDLYELASIDNMKYEYSQLQCLTIPSALE